MNLKGLTQRLALISAVTLGLAGITSPAQAGYTDCQPRGYACMWQGNTYPGNPNASFEYEIRYLSGSNDEVSSIVNNGYCGSFSIARYYIDYQFAGASFAMYCPESGLQSRDPYLTNGTNATSANWDNKISSARFVN